MSTYLNNLTTLALIYGNREIIATGIKITSEIALRWALEGAYSGSSYLFSSMFGKSEIESDRRKKTYHKKEGEDDEKEPDIEPKNERYNQLEGVDIQKPVIIYSEVNPCSCSHCLEQKAFLSQTVFKS